MHSKHTSAKTVLITGATSGIGFELTRLFAINGYRLIVIGRDRERLQEIQSWQDELQVEVHAMEKDLAKPHAAQEIMDELTARSITVDILINNAGLGAYGLFTETPLERELEMIQVNITTLTELTKLIVPQMVERKQGGILNVASVAAFQPGGPMMSVYYATKAYVLSFSEALANELRDEGVLVSVLCPGPTATDFEKRANLVQSKISQRNLMSAESVAKIAFREFMWGKTMIVPGAANRILAGSVRFLPRKMVTQMVRRFQNERDGRID